MKSFMVGVVIVFCFSASIYAQSAEELQNKSPILARSNTALSTIDWRGKTLAQVEKTEENAESVPFSGLRIRSVPRALLYSLVIPGTGEIYCNSYVKAAIMLGLEATFWTMYSVYNHKGDKKTTEFQNFADQHWHKELFLQWLSIADTISVPPVEHLPETKDQQYYEMIGKYNWFLTGWDDFNGNRNDPDPTHLSQHYCDSLGIGSAHREIYLDMRADANNFYKTAKYFIGASILNHVVSALDAAWTAKRQNDRLYKHFTDMHLHSGFAIKSGSPTVEMKLEVSFR